MFLDGLSFLDEEREAWRPYEALDELTDAQLVVSVEAAHGWSARDLMAHLVAWQERALAVARELAVGETSPTLDRMDAEWEARGGEAVNAEIQAGWAVLPLAELRRRFHDTPGELRGYLTVVPETRWVKDPRHMETFVGETLEHYEDHAADLRAILEAAR
jgi:hypothetical protein